MKARPILFSGPMVRALIDGRKTQTRRAVTGDKPGQPLDWLDVAGFAPSFVADPVNGLCPYGAPGDLLYARETWRTLQKWDGLKPRQLADDPSKITYDADPERRNSMWAFGKTRVSIHMPRWASRLTLEVTGVRIERLNSCSEADAIAEGVTPGATYGGKVETWLPSEDDRSVFYPSAREAYAALWRKINGADSWDANPWVWVVEFIVHHANVDTIIAARTA